MLMIQFMTKVKLSLELNANISCPLINFMFNYYFWSLFFVLMFRNNSQCFNCVILVPNILLLCQNSPYRWM